MNWLTAKMKLWISFIFASLLIFSLKIIVQDFAKVIMDHKELEKFFKICRKYRIKEIDFEGISVKFDDMPPPNEVEESSSDIPNNSLTEEDLAFYHLRDTI